MKKILLGSVVLLAMVTASHAAVITDLGVNPSSGAGIFSHSPGFGSFDDQYTFQLSGGTPFLAIASVTNTFASLSDFIFNFNGSVFNSVDGIIGNGNDIRVVGPIAATSCPITPNCQELSGSGILSAGSYYLDISGIAGSTAGYGGNLSVSAVPGPIVGAGLPGLLAAGLMLFGLQRRRRNSAMA
jgi:hypothetical protein